MLRGYYTVIVWSHLWASGCQSGTNGRFVSSSTILWGFTNFLLSPARPRVTAVQSTSELYNLNHESTMFSIPNCQTSDRVVVERRWSSSLMMAANRNNAICFSWNGIELIKQTMKYVLCVFRLRTKASNRSISTWFDARFIKKPVGGKCTYFWRRPLAVSNWFNAPTNHIIPLIKQLWLIVV